MNDRKRILICPLDWGLGHATRCIPIIRLLLQKNAEVIIAADGRPLALLQEEFPQLELIRLKGYDIQYPRNKNMMLKMFLSAPRIIIGIRKEHKALKKIIAERKIDIVISDNRFGLWNKMVKSIFITHQLTIQSPVAEKLLRRINVGYINNYDECWIPDVEGPDNLSGDLSHKYKIPSNAFFVGPLSRFNTSAVSEGEIDFRYDLLAILSGPEPQRSIFEQLLILQLENSDLKALVVCGKTEKNERRKINDRIELVDHLGSEELKTVIQQSKMIVARPGYSTLMDLSLFEKTAIFIPTPGQTEQEYLAKELMKKKIAYSQAQEDFNLAGALREADSYKGLKKQHPGAVLENRINLLFSK